MVGREPAIHFQERRQLILLFDLPGPPKLRLDAIFHTQPAEVFDVHVQYFRWLCMENCVQPEFRWTWQVKEKYQLTSFLKVYGGFTPDHDGSQVSIKIKSPVPMVVAMLP